MPTHHRRAAFLALTLLATACGGDDGGAGPDAVPPSVAITSPAPGPVSGVVTITADASDAGGVAGVRFEVDGNPVGAEDVTAPYAADWNSEAAADGEHELTAVARDDAGNVATSPAVTVVVSHTGAVGAIAVTVTVTGDGADDDGFAVVVDGSSRGTLPGAGILVVPDLSAGTHTVTLDGLFAFCELQGPSSPVVTVAAGETTGLDLTVDCAAVPGGRILYEGSLANGTHQFVTVDPDGSNPLVISASGTGSDWSPDRSRIAFTRSGDIHVMNADGSADAALFSSTEIEFDPRWSPDGTRLLYSAQGAGPGTSDLFVTEVASPDPQPLFATAAQRQSPAWSPDGSLIAYSRPTASGEVAIWVADAAGNVESQITEPLLTDVSAAWSPDGLRLAFRRQTSTGQPTQIWVVDVDGMNPVNLTTSAVFEYDPVWSPDGQWIAFTSERGGSQRVWIMRADGSHVVPVSPETYAFAGSRSWR